MKLPEAEGEIEEFPLALLMLPGVAKLRVVFAFKEISELSLIFSLFPKT